MTPNTEALRAAPELAVLLALDAVLAIAARALRAAHPDIKLPCLPDGRSLPLLRAAADAHDRMRDLRRALRHYHAALDAFRRIDDDNLPF